MLNTMNKAGNMSKEMTVGESIATLISMFFLVPMICAFCFWFCWTVCHIGETYFSFLPGVWQSIPFWNCVGLFICFFCVKLLWSK